MLSRVSNSVLWCTLALPVVAAQNENVRVFGREVPPQGGAHGEIANAFVPAGTNFSCIALNAGQCFDGHLSHALFPAGERQYAHGTGSPVACLVIVEPDNDCWTGMEWYRLPPGPISGAIVPPEGGSHGEPANALATVPLP